MYDDIRKSLDNVEKNPQSGNIGQQQHIAVTATLAKITADLVEEVIRLRQTILDLESQNHKLTKVTTVLSWVAVTFALIQVLPIILGFLDK